MTSIVLIFAIVHFQHFRSQRKATYSLGCHNYKVGLLSCKVENVRRETLLGERQLWTCSSYFQYEIIKHLSMDCLQTSGRAVSFPEAYKEWRSITTQQNQKRKLMQWEKPEKKHGCWGKCQVDSKGLGRALMIINSKGWSIFTWPLLDPQITDFHWNNFITNCFTGKVDKCVNGIAQSIWRKCFEKYTSTSKESFLTALNSLWFCCFKICPQCSACAWINNTYAEISSCHARIPKDVTALNLQAPFRLAWFLNISSKCLTCCFDFKYPLKHPNISNDVTTALSWPL